MTINDALGECCSNQVSEIGAALLAKLSTQFPSFGISIQSFFRDNTYDSGYFNSVYQSAVSTKYLMQLVSSILQNSPAQIKNSVQIEKYMLHRCDKLTVINAVGELNETYA